MTRSADVVIVGGGIVGCAVAHSATRRGLRVTLLDHPRPGRATTAAAGGLWGLGEALGLGCGVIFARARRERQGLESAGDDAPVALPEQFLEFALRSRAMFPSLAASLRDETGIDVELEPSSLLFVALDETDLAYARRLRSQRPSVFAPDDWLDPAALAKAEPALSRDVAGALRFRGDDQVNPYRLSDAMKAAARRRGAEVLRAEVTGLALRGSRVVGVETRDGPIACGTVVNAAGSWAAEVGRMAGLAVPVTPVRGQIVATEALPDVFSACLSTSQCYLAQKAHGEVLVGSTTEDAGFDVGVTTSSLRSLCEGAVRAVPMLERVRVKRAWAGLRPGSPDELPILGPADGVEGYLNATGHFRTGILTAPLSGEIVAALLAGEPPPHPVEPFLLSRFARHPASSGR